MVEDLTVDNMLDIQNVEDSDDVEQFVCFKLANEEYAVRIIDIQEVNRVQMITHIPQMPKFVLGVINIRGSVISVFDLRIKFNLADVAFSEKTKIVVAEVGSVSFSFIVDEILENIKLSKSKIDPAPSVASNIDKDCVVGIGELEGRMVTIIDLGKLQEDVIREIGVGNTK